MTPKEIKDLLAGVPFIPFRLHLTDGMSYDVRRPSDVMPLANALAVGIDRNEEGWPQRITYVDPRLVTRVEVETPPAPDAGGRP